MSDKVQALEAMLQAYISTCSDAQVIEVLDVLKKLISDIENDNLTQEKDTDSTEEVGREEDKKQRAEKKIIDIELFKKLYENARIHPDYSYPKLEKILKLNPNTIKTNTKRLYFKGAYRRLKDVVKLARVMDDKNVRRYEREIDGYNDI